MRLVKIDDDFIINMDNVAWIGFSDTTVNGVKKRKMYINDQSTINLDPMVAKEVIWAIESFGKYGDSGVKIIDTSDYAEDEIKELWT